MFTWEAWKCNAYAQVIAPNLPSPTVYMSTPSRLRPGRMATLLVLPTRRRRTGCSCSGTDCEGKGGRRYRGPGVSGTLFVLPVSDFRYLGRLS